VVPWTASASFSNSRSTRPHDVFVIGIGPVAFEHREFGIVPGRNAFIAEVAVDLEHLVGQPGDQRALEIEFRRDAQVHVELECVVVRLEGLGRGAAIDGMQHRRLDLHEAVILHEAADAGDDLRALLETQLRIGVGQDVEMALAVAQLDVGQTRATFRASAAATW
jgi:hypothetical protein